MSKMNAERAKAHDEMKRRALEVLDALGGKDIHIGALRDRLGIPASSDDARVLSVALGSLRDDDHVADQGRKRGWWKRVQPGQQALPMDDGRFKFQPETIAVLIRASLPWGLADEPTTTIGWAAGALYGIHAAVQDLSEGRTEQARSDLIEAAYTALCAYECLGDLPAEQKEEGQS